MISFTVAGVVYQAEEGMTWNDFLVSSYNNTNNKFIPHGYDGVTGVAISNSTGTYRVVLGSNDVAVTDTIIDGTTYGIVISGDSGGSAN